MMMEENKKIKRLEELILSLRDVQDSMAHEGMLIEGYDRTMENLQKRYYKLAGNYFFIVEPTHKGKLQDD